MPRFPPSNVAEARRVRARLALPKRHKPLRRVPGHGPRFPEPLLPPGALVHCPSNEQTDTDWPNWSRELPQGSSLRPSQAPRRPPTGTPLLPAPVAEALTSCRGSEALPCEPRPVLCWCSPLNHSQLPRGPPRGLPATGPVAPAPWPQPWPSSVARPRRPPAPPREGPGQPRCPSCLDGRSLSLHTRGLCAPEGPELLWAGRPGTHCERLGLCAPHGA